MASWTPQRCVPTNQPPRSGSGSASLLPTDRQPRQHSQAPRPPRKHARNVTRALPPDSSPCACIPQPLLDVSGCMHACVSAQRCALQLGASLLACNRPALHFDPHGSRPSHPTSNCVHAARGRGCSTQRSGGSAWTRLSGSSSGCGCGIVGAVACCWPLPSSISHPAAGEPGLHMRAHARAILLNMRPDAGYLEQRPISSQPTCLPCLGYPRAFTADALRPSLCAAGHQRLCIGSQHQWLTLPVDCQCGTRASGA